MTDREFKDLVFAQFAQITQAFAAPKRLEIIDILSQGERDVDSLSRQVSMSVANTSRHLQVLKHARLVDTRREGVRIFYRLSDDDISACWLRLQSLAEKRSAELRQIAQTYFSRRDNLEPVTHEELAQRVREKDVVVIDVRPTHEFHSGHIPGAISIPLAELKDRLDEIPRDHPVMAYCRGPYCVLSSRAIGLLTQAGFQAQRLKEGLPEWKFAGLPVEQTKPVA